MKNRVLIKEGEYRLAKAGVMDARVDAEALQDVVDGLAQRDDRAAALRRVGVSRKAGGIVNDWDGD